MSAIPLSIKNHFNAYFWNYTQTHGQALYNKAMEVCTQQKVGNGFWNIGVIALTGAVAGGVALGVDAIFHRIAVGFFRMMYPKDPRVEDKPELKIRGMSYRALASDLINQSFLFNTASIFFKSFAFMAGAAGGYQAALKLNPNLVVFSSDDVIKFSLFPLFASTAFVFLPSSSWGSIVVGMASILPIGAWSGALKSHFLYATAFSAALAGSGLGYNIALLYHKILP